MPHRLRAAQGGRNVDAVGDDDRRWIALQQLLQQGLQVRLRLGAGPPGFGRAEDLDALGVDQVSLAMKNIEQTMRSGVEVTRSTEAAARELSTLAEQMKQLVAQNTV